MENDTFLIKSNIELAITSEVVDPDLFTEEFNIQPIRHFRKGDHYISKHSKSIITRSHNLWAVESSIIIDDKEDLAPHFKYLKSIFNGKEDILQQYKQNSLVEVSLWIWIETDNAGVGIELSESDMSFINKIANRTHFSLLTSNRIIG